MSVGKIKVEVENIFPLIKKFLYSDHEIFLRELISNATDASLKLKHLASIGKTKAAIDDLQIEIKIDEKNNTLHIIDNGVGMTIDEVKKYINQVAFSGAEEFLEKYKDSKDNGIIGHFGLGFYSAFMVADKVKIHTLSHSKGAEPAHWSCEGNPEYSLKKGKKKDRGTEIILHINEESKEFLQNHRITELLNKYNKFMPIPIKFGTKKVSEPLPEDAPKDAKPEEKEVDNIINNPSPAWTKKPADLKDEDYQSFYNELYPYQFEKPLFHIHLNVDFPFNLTGILYFPKLSPNLQVQKDKIQLYQNQVFITDNVEGIVPEFLTMLRGVIDSPDIPLNVSRSYLQADGNVKKISEHITKKVSDKMKSLFVKDREDFEQKWNDVKIVIEYGILSEPKFNEKAMDYYLFPCSDDKYYTLEELKNETKETQTDKNDNLVVLYYSDKDAQYNYIKSAEEKGYKVAFLDSPLSSHLIQKMESENEKIKFTRVDAGPIEQLIEKEDTGISKLSEKEKESLKEMIEKNVPKETFSVQLKALDSATSPFLITQSEFMRRMKEMQATGGGGMAMMGNMPDSYDLIINENNPLADKILNEKDSKKQKEMIKSAFDIARLSMGLLKGEDLNKFVKNAYSTL